MELFNLFSNFMGGVRVFRGGTYGCGGNVMLFGSSLERVRGDRAWGEGVTP